MDEPAHAYAFLEWRYEPATRRLAGPGGERRLKPLLDRLLREFLDAPDRVLGRDFLISTVWTRREVNDEVLSRAIAELRSALGDDAREPRYIETLAKGGYRWITAVGRIGSRPAAPTDGVVIPMVPPTRVTLLVLGAIALLLAIGFSVRTRVDGGTRATARVLAARPLSADPRLEFEPRFDPGGHVIHVRREPGRAGSTLVMTDPQSRDERVLWQDDGLLRHPAPAANGREVAVIRQVGEACDVWSVSLLELKRARLGTCERPDAGLEWADDNALILGTLAVDDRHAAGLAVLDRLGGHRRVLTRPTLAEGEHVLPRLSRDRTRFAYASRRDGESQLWQTDWPAMQMRHAMLARHEPLFGHAFEADGNALWVAGDLIHHRALHRLLADRPALLIGGRGATSIDLAADDSAVWTEAVHDADIHVRGAGSSTWQAIGRSNRYETQPAFSADGSRLALVSNRNGSESIFLHDRRDGSTQALSLDPRLRWVRPTWSSGDDALILTGYEQRLTRLYRYRLDAAAPQPIESAGEGAFHGSELEGRLVWLAGHAEGRGRLMQLRDGRTTPEALDIGAVSAYRATSDWLVWRAPDSNRLEVAGWDDLAHPRAIELGAEGPRESFALSGKSLTWLDRGNLWTLDLPDGEPRRLDTLLLPDAQGPNLASTADGTLAIASTVSIAVDLMYAPGADSMTDPGGPAPETAARR